MWQFIQVDNPLVFRLCQAVGSAPCGEGVGGPKKFNPVDLQDAAVYEGPGKPTLRVGERRGLNED